MVFDRNSRVFFSALLIFCLIVYAYFPVLSHSFGYFNDYDIWASIKTQSHFLIYPETAYIIAMGRPLLAIFLNLYLMHITSVASLHIAHLFSVLSIGIAAILYFLYLQKELNISRFSAVLLSVLTFTLP